MSGSTVRSRLRPHFRCCCSRAAPAGPVGRVPGAARALRRAAFPLGEPAAPGGRAATQDRLGRYLYDNPDKARFRSVVTGLAPDILVTQEAKFGWPAALQNLRDCRTGRRRLPTGTAIRAQPLSDEGHAGPDMPPPANARRRPAIRVEVQVHRDARRSSSMPSTHRPRAPWSDGGPATSTSFDRPAHRGGARRQQVVLAGDWNTPVWTPASAASSPSATCSRPSGRRGPP